jgi:transcriptional regulator with XRE-family HTH domain
LKDVLGRLRTSWDFCLLTSIFIVRSEMANERLRAAMTNAGIHINDLAELARVDAKTVQRWLGGRQPYSRHRQAIAKALGTDERSLWPELNKPAPAGEDRQEILAAFAYANDLLAPDWRVMLTTATSQIDLLDYTLLDVLRTPGVPDLLAAKAAAGCHVRILISAEDSFFVQVFDAERDLADLSPAASETNFEIALARGYLEPLLQQPGIEIREYVANRFNSIVRVDDEMLLTLHLWAAPGSQAPLLHLRRDGEDGLFERFAGHYDALWHHAAKPIGPDPEIYPHPDQHPDRYQPPPEPGTPDRQQRESESP